MLGVYPVTLTDRRMNACIIFDDMSGRILTNDDPTKPPAGLLMHSQRDHKRVAEDFLEQTMRNPREVSSYATRLQPPAGLLMHSQRDHKRVAEDFLEQTMRNPREVSSYATRLQPPAGLLIHSQRDHKRVVEDFLEQTMRNPREVICCKK